MLEPHRIPDLDRWLDELDELVETGAPSAHFYRRCLGQLRVLLSAEGTAVIFPSKSGWDVFASDGKVGERNSPNSIAVPIRKAASHKGLLIAFFDHEMPEAGEAAARELMTGVAEAIAVHQRATIERFLDEDWGRLQTSLTLLRRSETFAEAAFVFVNELRPIFKATRVSLIEGDSVSAVSGVDRIDQGSPLVSAIKKAIRPEAEAAPKRANDLAVEIAAHHTVTPLTSSTSLLIEWSDEDRAKDAVALVQQFSTTITEAWNQQSRWLTLPKPLRRYAVRSSSTAMSSSFLRRMAIGGLIAIALATVSLWPWSFRIHSTGRLQPVEQRSVFVTADGFIEEIMVGDGENVEADQPLLRVKSHLLDREIERIRGELATLREKRSGIDIALNEAAAEFAGRSNAESSQSKLTTELRVLDVEEKGLAEQMKLIESELEKLVIRAPIAGTVVAHDLQKYLDRRPVKCGDMLFRIADMEGPWQLELEIADRDLSYIVKHFVDKTDSPKIDYTLAADPATHLEATLSWLAPIAYRRPENGVVVEAHATIDSKQLDKRHMGAKVDATFACGKQPIWFIWSRPLVEELQRRFWW